MELSHDFESVKNRKVDKLHVNKTENHLRKSSASSHIASEAYVTK